MKKKIVFCFFILISFIIVINFRNTYKTKFSLDNIFKFDFSQLIIKNNLINNNINSDKNSYNSNELTDKNSMNINNIFENKLIEENIIEQSRLKNNIENDITNNNSNVDVVLADDSNQVLIQNEENSYNAIYKDEKILKQEINQYEEVTNQEKVQENESKFKKNIEKNDIEKNDIEKNDIEKNDIEKNDIEKNVVLESNIYNIKDEKNIINNISTNDNMPKFNLSDIETISNESTICKISDMNKNFAIDSHENETDTSRLELNYRERILLDFSTMFPEWNLENDEIKNLEHIVYPRLKILKEDEEGYKYFITFQKCYKNGDGTYSTNGDVVYYSRSKDLKDWDTPQILFGSGSDIRNFAFYVYKSENESEKLTTKLFYTSCDSCILNDGTIMTVCAGYRRSKYR